MNILGTKSSSAVNFDIAFEGIRLLTQQIKFNELSGINENDGIRIIIQSYFDSSRSSQDLGFLYFYKVSIENISKKAVTLLGRHWVFKAGHDYEVKVPRFSPGYEF